MCFNILNLRQLFAKADGFDQIYYEYKTRKHPIAPEVDTSQQPMTSSPAKQAAITTEQHADTNTTQTSINRLVVKEKPPQISLLHPEVLVPGLVPVLNRGTAINPPSPHVEYYFLDDDIDQLPSNAHGKEDFIQLRVAIPAEPR